MRSSCTGVTAELLPRSPRLTDLVARRASGWCSRFSFAVVTLSAFLLTAVFLVQELQTTGSSVVAVTTQRVRPAPQGSTPKTRQTGTVLQTSSIGAVAAVKQQQQQQRNHWKEQLQQTPEVVTGPPSRAYATHRPCPNNCSNMGNCLSDLGECQCPGAWRGADCSQLMPRPCTDQISQPGSNTTSSHVDSKGRDLNLTAGAWTAGRCSGVCDLEYGQCYCPPVGKYGRINPPPGSPPGTPAVQQGRPLSHPCKAPRTDANGTPIFFGMQSVSWDMLYGAPNGWCIADEPLMDTLCRCILDGWDGPGCSIPTESFCLNQCSRRGVCHQRGFCQCQPGWYGIDCAHPSDTAAAAQPPAAAGADSWLADVSVDAWACYTNRTGCIEDKALAAYIAYPPFAGQQQVQSSPSSNSGTSARRLSSSSSSSSSVSNAPHRSLLAAAEQTCPVLAKLQSSAHMLAAAAASNLRAVDRQSNSSLAASAQTAVRAAEAAVKYIDAVIAASRVNTTTTHSKADTQVPAAAGVNPCNAASKSSSSQCLPGTGNHDANSSASSTSGSSSITSNSSSSITSSSSSNSSHSSSMTAAGSSRQQEESQVRPKGRPRPLIYIYNGPPDVNSHALQYREQKAGCSWRYWHHEPGLNVTGVTNDGYGSESLLPELLMGSKHRTLNPEEADYFFVPVLPACWMTHVSATHDFPWFYKPTGHRVKSAAVMYWHALNWIRTRYPYWNASRGADHIWLFPHDEGACWAPKEIYDNSIILTHWGRSTPDNLPSHTQYYADDYTNLEHAKDDLLPMPYTELIGRHRCYTPGKDLVLPVVKMPTFYSGSPYLTGIQPHRHLLAFHRGRMGNTADFNPSYSLGVRQAIAKAAAEQDWVANHNIHVGSQGSAEGEYTDLLARSVFCFVLQGEGYTTRFDDAILHGCIPVVVINETVGPWGAEMDWEAFSIRISPQHVPQIPSILKGVPQDKIASMQAKLADIWHRFAWLSHPVLARMAIEAHKPSARRSQQPVPSRRVLKQRHMTSAPAPTLSAERVQQDAVHSLLQLLGSWVPRTGATAARRAAQQVRSPTEEPQQQHKQ